MAGHESASNHHFTSFRSVCYLGCFEAAGTITRRFALLWFLLAPIRRKYYRLVFLYGRAAAVNVYGNCYYRLLFVFNANRVITSTFTIFMAIHQSYKLDDVQNLLTLRCCLSISKTEAAKLCYVYGFGS